MFFCSFVFRFSSPSVRLSSVVVLSLELIPDLAEIFDLSSGFVFLSIEAQLLITTHLPNHIGIQKMAALFILSSVFAVLILQLKVAFVLSEEQVSFFLNWGLNLGLVGML